MISVLYVDDEGSLLEITKLFLEGMGGFQVDTADSAPHALDMLQHRNYDAIISDYQMPGINGIEFLKILRGRYPDLPFIIFTGKDREEIAITAFENGADFYHQKGGNPEVQYAELSHKIRKSVAHHQAEQAMREAERLLLRQIRNSSDFLRILDTDGRVIHDAPSTSSVLGYPYNFFTGKFMDNYIHPKDLESAIAAFDHIRNRKKPEMPFGFRIRKADGMYITMASLAMNLVGVRGVDGIVVATWPAHEGSSAMHELHVSGNRQAGFPVRSNRGIVP